MLRPNGQLVLIDFGAVKEETQTYLKKQNMTNTVIGSPGYAPPEQARGRAVLQSDFFALGRTFVYLLTGKHPCELEDSQTGQLIWRNRSPQSQLADLIDDLMAPLPPVSNNRPKNTQEILQRLDKIETAINSSPLRTLPSRNHPTSPTGGNNSAITFTMLPNSGNKRLGLAIFVIAILLLVAVLKPKPQTACDSEVSDNLSCGEEVLVPDSGVSFKREGVEKFADGKYAEAVTLLEKARKEQPSDPETLIYLNNARLGTQKAYTIAVIAPLSKSSDTALEYLRGVAQAQDEINQKKINGIGLRMLIADDANNPNQARQIAEKLVSKGDILAVVGHYASEVTLAAVPVYQQHGLVLISPASTSEELSFWGNIPNHVFFRTAPNTRVTAQFLASYLIAQARQQTAAVFYSPKSSFSHSLQEQFEISFLASGGKVVKFDLSNPAFNAKAAIKQAQQQGATVLGVFLDGVTTVHALPNTLRLIRANQGRNWIVGGTTLYTPDTLQLVRKDALNRFVIAVT